MFPECLLHSPEWFSASLKSRLAGLNSAIIEKNRSRRTKENHHVIHHCAWYATDTRCMSSSMLCFAACYLVLSLFLSSTIQTINSNVQTKRKLKPLFIRNWSQLNTSLCACFLCWSNEETEPATTTVILKTKAHIAAKRQSTMPFYIHFALQLHCVLGIVVTIT